MLRKLYFRVSGSWMMTHPTEEANARVFEVVGRKANPMEGQPEVLFLHSEEHEGEMWPVLVTRGHFVEPFTIALVNGVFQPAPADFRATGTALCTHGEYPSEGHAERACMAFNEEMRLAIEAKTKQPA